MTKFYEFHLIINFLPNIEVVKEKKGAQATKMVIPKN